MSLFDDKPPQPPKNGRYSLKEIVFGLSLLSAGGLTGTVANQSILPAPKCNVQRIENRINTIKDDMDFKYNQIHNELKAVLDLLYDIKKENSIKR